MSDKTIIEEHSSSQYETASGAALQEIVNAQQSHLSKQSRFVNFSACTMSPNTASSDMDMFVWHRVNYTEIEPGGCVFSKSIEMLAMCPMSAIDQAHEYLTNSD
tara:strand:- start:2130 stop:2441 length:312 start_codon:yes stop_codon:yes gene_type:complete